MSRGKWAALIAAVCLVVTMLTGTVWGHPDLEGWSGGCELYTVGPGDTLQKIAVRFGVSADLIADFNALSSSAELAPGQDLVIPILLNSAFSPRCAIVIRPSLITNEPGGGDSLWRFPVGSLVVVKDEVHS